MTVLASIKLAAVLAIASLLFFGGRSCGAQAQRADVQQLQRLTDAKSRALHAAARSFSAFAATFRAIDANTEARLAAAARLADDAKAAGDQANAAEADAAARAHVLEQALARARRQRPGCPAVFEADLGALCGVTLR